jgi:hypothetical protein
MLCPRCGAENDLEQSYCRQCGLSLSAVRLTLEGHIDEARVKIQKARNTLRNGAGITGISILILIVGHLIGAIGGHILILTPFDLLCLGMMMVIGMPLIIKGVLMIERANNLLSGKADFRSLALEQGKGSVTGLPAAGPDSALGRGLQSGDSVTEHTTIHLEDHKPKGN